MKAWKRLIIGILAGLILVIVVYYAWLQRLFHIEPDTGFLYPEKTKFVRYYACSLALCTRGCGSDVVNEICLENDTTTPECDLGCQDICDDNPFDWPTDRESEWSNPSGGVVCGKPFPLNLHLETEVPMRGCIYLGQVNIDGDSNYIRTDTETNQIIDKIQEVGEEFPESYGSDGLLDSRGGCIIFGPTAWSWCMTLGGIYQIGTPEQKYERCCVDLGSGGIMLDPTDIYEKYSCFDKRLPWIPLTTIDCPGFYQCVFKPGDLTLTSDWEKNGQADILITSGPIEDWGFEIEASPSLQSMTLDDTTATFTVEITNNLGDTSFTLSIDNSLSTFPDGTTLACTFDPTPLSVEDGDADESTMTCTPSSPGDYDIWIRVSPRTGVASEYARVTLKVVNFELEIIKPSSKHLDIGKNVDAEFEVRITNEMGEEVTFQLNHDYSGPGILDCSFIPTSLTIAHGGSGISKLSCYSATEGDYTISVWSEVGSIRKSDGATITVLECWGDLKLTIDTETIESGDTFTVKAEGLSGCEDRSVSLSVNYPELDIGYCDNWVGGVCEKTFIANTPGVYTLYGFVRLIGSGTGDDPREMNTTDLTISVDAPPGKDVDLGNCFFAWGGHGACAWPCGGYPGMCDYCKGNQYCGIPLVNGWLPQNCEDKLDPQTNGGAMFANICCLYNSDYYDNGPDDVPCFTTDTYTTDYGSNGFFWSNTLTWVGRVNNPRDLLVLDSNYARLENYQTCRTDSDCGCGWGPILPDLPVKDCDGIEQETILTTECDEDIYSPTYSYCVFSGTNEAFLAWMYIRINPYGSYRPIYGLDIYYKGCMQSAEIRNVDLNIYVHNSAGWSYKYTLQTTNQAGGATRITPGSSQWTWDEADGILIGLAQGTEEGCIDIDYIGLLTTDGATPYCTDGDSMFNRVVDNGVRCYWDTNCNSGGGWGNYKLSEGVGAVSECSCTDGSCGRGYCEKIAGGRNFCYYEVECANGGWRNTAIDICDLGNPSRDECTFQGCR